jgi:hypothetical protein
MCCKEKIGETICCKEKRRARDSREMCINHIYTFLYKARDSREMCICDYMRRLRYPSVGSLGPHAVIPTGLRPRRWPGGPEDSRGCDVACRVARAREGPLVHMPPEVRCARCWQEPLRCECHGQYSSDRRMCHGRWVRKGRGECTGLARVWP